MKFIFLILSIYLVGCAYPKKTEFFRSAESNPEKAVLYIYRTPTSVDSLNPEVPSFYVNGDKIGKLSIGGYYMVLIPPGSVVINYKTPLFGMPLFMSPQELKITAAANQVYFVKFSIESIMRITDLKLVPNHVGEGEIKTTQLLVN
jgi:hypothetical protein